MKTTNFKLLLFTLAIVLVACKEETAKEIEYKFADKTQVISCENENSKLLNDAIYSFEDDLLAHYKKANNNVISAYSNFIREAAVGRAPYSEIVSKHTVDVFDALKNEQDLWVVNNNEHHLNYNSNLMSCISSNITNEDLKITLNALISTNSMKKSLYAEAIKSNLIQTRNDKYISLYIALDYFYANLFDIDFTKVNLEKPDSNVDFNQTPQTPQQPKIDEHAGHDHD